MAARQAKEMTPLRVGVEITIAPAAPAPIVQTVSKIGTIIDTRVVQTCLLARANLFDFDCFSFMAISFSLIPQKRRMQRRTTRTSAARGFEPHPTPEVVVTSLFRCDALLSQVRLTPYRRVGG